MAYTDFTPADLAQRFELDFQADNLFPACPPLAASDWLTETLARAQRLGYVSEKSRSERLVSPVLTELHELNQQRFTLHSGVNLDVDAAAGLRGECDFVLTASPIRDFIMARFSALPKPKSKIWRLAPCSVPPNSWVLSASTSCRTGRAPSYTVVPPPAWIGAFYA